MKNTKTIINEEEKDRMLKEDLRLMGSRRTDVEKDKPIEEGEKIETNEIISEINESAQN